MKLPLRVLSTAAAAALLMSSFPVNVLAADGDGITEGRFKYMPSSEDAPEEDSFFYSDNYFAGSPAEENPHLRSMSMALAMSTIEERGSSCVSELYRSIGFEDIAVGDMNDTPTKDTIGTAIAHKTVGSQELVAVAVRGSKYYSEWAANLTAGAEGNIDGFEEPAEKVMDRIRKYISDNGLEGVKLWITGYSRGGGVADLTGAYITAHPEEFQTSAEDVFVYTFESPRTCADDTVYENIHNVRNRNDIINYVYPEKWGIHSCGKDEWIGGEKTFDIKIFGFDEGGAAIIDDGDTVGRQDFLEEFIDELTKDITRESFSGELDDRIAELILICMDRTPEERQRLTDYIKESFSGDIMDKLSPLMTDIFTVMAHNTDEAYRMLADDVEAALAEKYKADLLAGKDIPLTEAELQTVRDSVYPLLRNVGPCLVRDFCHVKGVDTDETLPDGYYDPFDPRAAEPDETLNAAEAFVKDSSLGDGIYSRSQPLYYFATLAKYSDEIVWEHTAQCVWELVKAEDSYYDEPEPQRGRAEYFGRVIDEETLYDDQALRDIGFNGTDIEYLKNGLDVSYRIEYDLSEAVPYENASGDSKKKLDEYLKENPMKLHYSFVTGFYPARQRGSEEPEKLSGITDVKGQFGIASADFGSGEKVLENGSLRFVYLGGDKAAETEIKPISDTGDSIRFEFVFLGTGDYAMLYEQKSDSSDSSSGGSGSSSSGAAPRGGDENPATGAGASAAAVILSAAAVMAVRRKQSGQRR